MTLRRVGVYVFYVAIATTARSQSDPALSLRRITAENANGCITSPMTCGGASTGTLGVSDCTFSDGTYYDRYTFSGNAGDLVTIDVRALSSKLTNPMIVLAPPLNDASKTPIIYGGTGASVTYVLSSSGTWVIGVGTHDLLASGDYFIDLTCERDPAPSHPQNCVTQSLTCGQFAAWNLTAQSCRFGNDPNTLYQDFEIYGIAGDIATVTMQSPDFEPNFGIFNEKTGEYVGNATLVDTTTAQQVIAFPETGFYDVVATSRKDLQTGFFSLNVNCVASGCLWPVIVSQPAKTSSVQAGGRASVSFVANGSAPMSAVWYELPGIAVGSGAGLMTPPLFVSTGYYATVSNPCGTATTDVASVLVQPVKHRAASHR